MSKIQHNNEISRQLTIRRTNQQPVLKRIKGITVINRHIPTLPKASTTPYLVAKNPPVGKG